MVTFQNMDAVNYLLGKLDEAEQEAIERDYFQKTGSFDELLMAESELYDAYVLDKLAADDRDRFECRLLITARQRQRAGFADALVNYVSSGHTAAIRPSTRGAGWIRSFKELFLSQHLLFYSLASASVLLMAIGAFWWISLDRGGAAETQVAGSSAPAEPVPAPPSTSSSMPESMVTDATPSPSDPPLTERAAAAPRPPAAKAEKQRANPIAALVSTIVLSPGATRDNSGGEVFVVPSASTHLDLRLEFEELGHSSYFAVVETADGQQVWRGKVTHKGEVAFARIPSKRIKAGDYIVSLKGLHPSKTYDPVADYSFTIERK